MSNEIRTNPLTGEPARSSPQPEAGAHRTTARSGNQFAQALLYGAIVPFALGLIIFMVGIGTEATFENPTGGAGAVMLGSGMMGMGWTLFVAWLATSSINWQIRTQSNMQDRDRR
jgi:hypothetical protein